MTNIYGRIYIIRNTINNKVYIGQTISKNYKKRVNAHFKKQRGTDLVYISSLKYGKDKFISEVLYEAFDKDSLDLAEIQLINTYNSKQPYGYNIQNGGNGPGKLDEDTLIKISKSIKEWYKYNQHPLKDTRFTEEHVSNLSKARKGFDSENRKKAREKTLKERLEGLGIKSVNIKTREIQIHSCIADCARTLNLIESCISRVLQGKQNRTQHKGYQFEYIDKENNQLQLRKSREMYGINKINKGGYSIKLKGNYLGWRSTLEEAKKVRDEYLKESRKRA